MSKCVIGINPEGEIVSHYGGLFYEMKIDNNSRVSLGKTGAGPFASVYPEPSDSDFVFAQDKRRTEYRKRRPISSIVRLE